MALLEFWKLIFFFFFFDNFFLEIIFDILMLNITLIIKIICKREIINNKNQSLCCIIGVEYIYLSIRVPRSL